MVFTSAEMLTGISGPYIKYGTACAAGVEHPALRRLTSPEKILSSGAGPAALLRSNPAALIDLLKCL